MYSFDNRSNMYELIHAFKEIDKLRATFNQSFCIRMHSIFRSYSVQLEMSKISDQFMHDSANEIQNITESVVDKDRNYPVYRLTEEWQKMKVLANKESPKAVSIHLYGALLNEVKALMVESNKKVYDLSGVGFRLLDANAKVFLLRFVSRYQTYI